MQFIILLLKYLGLGLISGFPFFPCKSQIHNVLNSLYPGLKLDPVSQDLGLFLKKDGPGRIADKTCFW